MNGNKKFWSRWSGIYDAFMRGNQAVYGEMTERMKQHLNKRMKALELACGTGLISQQIEETGKRRLWKTD